MRTRLAISELRYPLLLDAGMGTALIARGLDSSAESSAVWNLSHPADVAAVHESHYEAGAQLLHTNTFMANRVALRRENRNEVLEINRAAVVLARNVATDIPIAGNLGPTGDVPPPEGEASLDELENAYKEQAEILAEAGVDLLHIETMHHPKEVRAALRACRAGAPSLAIVLSITCKPHDRGYRTPAGYGVDTLVAVALEEGVEGLGSNCSMSPADMTGMVSALTQTRVDAVWAQPTAVPDGVPPLLPDEFAEGLCGLVDAGATAVGGCCGASPADLAATKVQLLARTNDQTGKGY